MMVNSRPLNKIFSALVALCAIFVAHSTSARAEGDDVVQVMALGDSLTNSIQRRVKQRNGLREIHDVDAVAVAIDVLTHTWVPAVRLVTKMNACFQHLAHCKSGKSHLIYSYSPVKPPWEQMKGHCLHRMSNSEEFATPRPLPCVNFRTTYY